jgi:hypothetical protein
MQQPNPVSGLTLSQPTTENAGRHYETRMPKGNVNDQSCNRVLYRCNVPRRAGGPPASLEARASPMQYNHQAWSPKYPPCLLES